MIFAKTCNFIIYGQLLCSSSTRLFKNLKHVEHSLFISRFWSVSTGWTNNDFTSETPSYIERDYFRSIMEHNPKYPACVFANFSVNNENSTNAFVLKLRTLVAEEVEGLKESHGHDKSNIEDFKNELFTLDDFIETFYLLSNPAMKLRMPFDSKQLRDFLGYKKIDYNSESLSKCLILLHQMRKVDFRICRLSVSFSTVDYVHKKYKAMTSTQIIEFFYFLHFYKGSYVRKETKYDFEKTLASHMPHFTLDEIAVIAYGLFRSQNHPGSLLSSVICEQIEEHVLTLNEVQASVFSKFLHYSGRRRIAENIHRILEKSTSIIDRLTLTTAIHVGCSGITVNVENAGLINCILEKMIQQFSVARLKDIERLLLACLYANIQLSEQSDFIRLIVETLHTKTNEIRKFPRAYLSLIQYLIMYGVYLDDQINFALSEDCFQLLLPGSMKNKLHELLFIDSSVEIERPHYKGNRLPVVQRKKITMRDFHSVDYPDFTSSWKNNKEILETLAKYYGESSCSLKRLLPNYDTLHPVLCLNNNDEAQEIKDKLEKPCGIVIKAPEDGNKWLAFITVRRQGCLSDGVTPNFVTEAKLRQFKAAGYIPIMIHGHMWRMRTPVENDIYLHGVLQKVLGNSSTAENDRLST